MDSEVRVDNAMLEWEQTGGHKILKGWIQKFLEGKDIKDLLGKSYADDMMISRALTVYDKSDDKLDKPVELQRVISTTDIDIPENGIADLKIPVSFSKVDMLAGEKAGTFKHEKGKTTVMQIKKATKGYDLGEKATRDIREKEVIVRGKFRVVEKTDEKVVLEEVDS